MQINSAPMPAARPNLASGTTTSGRNAKATTIIPITRQRSEPQRAENQRVIRNCAATATAPETTNVAAIRIDSCSGLKLAACSGSARYTWKDSTYDPIIAVANSRNDRLASTERQSCRIDVRPSPDSTSRCGRANNCAMVSAANTAAAMAAVSRKSTAMNANPTSGPASIPA